MNGKEIASRGAHSLPADLRDTILTDGEVLTIWEAIAQLAPNERICLTHHIEKNQAGEKRVKQPDRIRKDERKRQSVLFEHHLTSLLHV